METYISILRGINVSGQKLIKMEELRKMYENLGLSNVTTYVQSGNVLFTADNYEIKKLELIITQQIENDFEFSVPVLVLTAGDLKQIINNNPFLADPHKEQSYMHITFLSSKPKDYKKETIESKKQNDEEIYFSEKVIYLYCPKGYGRTKLTNTFLESKLKVVATTRNWKTSNKLLEIANSII